MVEIHFASRLRQQRRPSSRQPRSHTNLAFGKTTLVVPARQATNSEFSTVRPEYVSHCKGARRRGAGLLLSVGSGGFLVPAGKRRNGLGSVADCCERDPIA